MTMLNKALLLAGVLLCLLGCDKATRKSVQQVSVSGEVTLDGERLEAGVVIFHCDPKKTDGAGVQAFGFIENGSYHIGLDQGPVVGLAQVEFRSKPIQRELLEEAVDQEAKRRHRRPPSLAVIEIPSKYGLNSGLQVMLSYGENRHDFDLNSKR